MAGQYGTPGGIQQGGQNYWQGSGTPQSSYYADDNTPAGDYSSYVDPQNGQGAAAARQLGGSAIKNVMQSASGKLPGGLSNFGGGAGGSLGSLAGIAGGGMMAGQGINQLINSKSGWGDIGGGAETGAGIGTMIMPGVGTAIGAGLGALGGGVKALFRIGKPSPEELNDRSNTQNIYQDNASHATPQELQEAQQVYDASQGKQGAWQNTQAPLQLVMLKNALVKSGMDPAAAQSQANSMTSQLWGSEKDPNAYKANFAALNNIMTKYGSGMQQPGAGAPGSSPTGTPTGATSAFDVFHVNSPYFGKF